MNLTLFSRDPRAAAVFAWLKSARCASVLTSAAEDGQVEADGFI